MRSVLQLGQDDRFERSPSLRPTGWVTLTVFPAFGTTHKQISCGTRSYLSLIHSTLHNSFLSRSFPFIDTLVSSNVTDAISVHLTTETRFHQTLQLGPWPKPYRNVRQPWLVQSYPLPGVIVLHSTKLSLKPTNSQVTISTATGSNSFPFEPWRFMASMQLLLLRFYCYHHINLTIPNDTVLHLIVSFSVHRQEEKTFHC